MRKENILDKQLILKIRQGDIDAFERLVNRWNQKFLAFTYKYIRDFETSKDLVQDGWISIYNGLASLKEASKFSSWAFRIIYHKIIDHGKKEYRNNEAAGQVVYQNDIPDNDEELSIDELLKKLPATQKSILTLFYLENQSIRQIAKLLNISEGTVKSRIFYAREKLKKIINNSNYESYR